jgi:OmpA-OmpF porin, OOP family
MYNSKSICLTVLLCLSFYAINAQKWSYSAQIGTTVYLGDVSEKIAWQPNVNRTVLGASLSYEALDFLNIRLNAIGGRLSGRDGENTEIEWRKLRAFSFQTPFVEASIMTEFDALKAIFGDITTKNNRLTTHLLLGVGVSHIAPKVNFNEPNPISELTYLDKQAVYSRNQIVVPLGIAVKWQLNQTSTFRFESTVRKTFSDYFDGISKTGNPRYNDFYATVMVGWERKLSWGLTGWKKFRFVNNDGLFCPRF